VRDREETLSLVWEWTPGIGRSCYVSLAQVASFPNGMARSSRLGKTFPRQFCCQVESRPVWALGKSWQRHGAGVGDDLVLDRNLHRAPVRIFPNFGHGIVAVVKMRREEI
jgi:hypothetical protein